MGIFARYLDDQLSRGRAWFSREEGLRALGLSAESFAAAAGRQIRKQRLVSPRQGFYLILRPEDRIAGAPDPVCWIDPLMKYQGIDYRISLLSAAAYHGSSHQAAMVFQVIVPRQLRDLEIGGHRLQFITQKSALFAKVNRPDWLAQVKSSAGFAAVAGVELTLLDAMRYFHKAAGINGVAQIVKDIGGAAGLRKLGEAGKYYENSTVRRLGYLLDLFGHVRQARALEDCARQAKSSKLLDPSIMELPGLLSRFREKEPRWKLIVNEQVEADF
ncbi:MAG: type IV toxin-antitoxin system AbiEi family antitoxin [Alphaproteobacteria bacterium]|nr:type IV toxin-antitoxin system AbiEi family antitoxin [Alphaproteobacteria bacterium]